MRENSDMAEVSATQGPAGIVNLNVGTDNSPVHAGDKSPSVGSVDWRLDVGHGCKGRSQELYPFSCARTLG